MLSYLTDSFGRPSHYYDQLTFGESMVEHNQSSYYNNGYKFNEKDQDEATEFQNAGSALDYAALAISITGVGAPISGVLGIVGAVMAGVGTVIETYYLLDQAKYQEAASKVAVTAFFIAAGKIGEKYGPKDNSSQTLIQGLNLIIDNTIGKDIEKSINKK